MTTTRIRPADFTNAQIALIRVITATFPSIDYYVSVNGAVVLTLKTSNDAIDAFLLIKSIKDDMQAKAIIDVAHIGFRVCAWFDV